MKLPEKGWTALSVREAVGDRIKTFAREEGMSVNDFLVENLPDLWDLEIETTRTKKKIINTKLANEPRQQIKNFDGKWMVCEHCGARVKTKNFEIHMMKVHPLLQ